MVSLLVVDDDATFLEVVCRALRAKGFTVAAAQDGRQALAIIKAAAPDLLLTDIFMQDVDGIALISAVMAGYSSVRVIAMSGHGQIVSMDVLNLAAQLGAHATIAKPFSITHLLDTIAETLHAPSA